MVRSRLPVPSLFFLFEALLVLSPELLMGIPETLSKVPFTDPEVQHALAFAVQQYNQDREDSANYFKVLCAAQSQSQVDGWTEYHLRVELVKTTCEKKANKLTYEKIQECEQLPETQKKPICYFKVTPRSLPNLIYTVLSVCT